MKVTFLKYINRFEFTLNYTHVFVLNEQLHNCDMNVGTPCRLISI